MSDSVPECVTLGQAELPPVLSTLAATLPQFEGGDLENQLQTHDIFLGILAPSVRPQIAALLSQAAVQAANPRTRVRLQEASQSVAGGGKRSLPTS